jgi:NosR/NirI family transcriptional regulator, nitrous oxide reductase regulator
VHERLWALKYIILLVLFGISLQSLNSAEHYAEIEPFKTTFTLHFARSWSYVLYAVALIGVSAFNHKFYCRYVCPLGAGLAVSGRWRLFEWLRRRPECGKPCQVCANECEVKAIHADGRIDFNECHYCLDCQVTRVNDHKCPPIVQQRKKRERAARPLPTPVLTITPASTPATPEPAQAAD